MSARRQVMQVAVNRLVAAAEVGFARFECPVAGEIVKVRALVDTGPSGGDSVFDVNVNGTSIWDADQSQRVKILDGDLDGEVLDDLPTGIFVVAVGT